jgi:hypothetical protein
MKLRKALGPLLALLLLIGVSAAVSYSVREAKQARIARQRAAARITVRILASSEKEHFLDDPELARVLAGQGMAITWQKAGSREITSRPDLKDFDVAFPAGTHPALKIAETAGSKRIFTLCYTPMAVASWKSLIPVLEQSGLVSRRQNTWFIVNMGKLLDLMEKGTRWKDLPGNTDYAVGKSFLVTTTDIRKSNSAAMYLSLAAYLANGNNVVSSDADAEKIAAKMVSLFSRQGFQEASEAGPFEDYAAMGIGKSPLVMIYEQQFLEYVISHANPNPDMVLLYPEPTILSKHTLVALTDNGERFAKEMVSDPKVSSIAQRYGFRTENNTELFATLEAKKLAIPHTLVDVIDPPTDEILDKLIHRIEEGLKQ